MKILGDEYTLQGTLDNFLTVPDCWVKGKNKLGTGHGEKKLYITSKEAMREFYGPEGFDARCFILKSDLLAYMYALKEEYMHPSFDYAGKADFPNLWQKRIEYINTLDDIIYFNLQDQYQIAGPRGYVNSDDEGYDIIRNISLPLVSYISAMRLKDPNNQEVFYWKLFVDFDAIEDKSQALVFTYGKGEEAQDEEPIIPEVNEKKKEISRARIGQGKYRELLLEECPFCPITKITDERLLIASHIKPWVASSDEEKIDPKNGFMLSPLYDKLFDRGFITFTNDRRVVISDWLTPQNKRRIGIEDGQFIQALPLDDKRIEYLSFHRDSVFHGLIG